MVLVAFHRVGFTRASLAVSDDCCVVPIDNRLHQPHRPRITVELVLLNILKHSVELKCLLVYSDCGVC
jgi:hypothetical protein